MPGKKLILSTLFVALFLLCYGATVTSQNYLLKQQVSRLESDLSGFKKQPTATQLDFPFPTTYAATEGFGVERGMKADEIDFRGGAASNVGVRRDVERAMIPTKNPSPAR